jgi:hypothetical protein
VDGNLGQDSVEIEARKTLVNLWIRCRPSGPDMLVQFQSKVYYAAKALIDACEPSKLEEWERYPLAALNGFDSNMTFLQKRIRETIKLFPDD